MKRYQLEDEIFSYTGDGHIELCGMGQCIVDGLQGITEYSDSKIKFNLGKYSVSIYGSELCINSFTKEGAVVEGSIISLEYESND
jgi:sporulation protein YqfC